MKSPIVKDVKKLTNALHKKSIKKVPYIDPNDVTGAMFTYSDIGTSVEMPENCPKPEFVYEKESVEELMERYEDGTDREQALLFAILDARQNEGSK